MAPKKQKVLPKTEEKKVVEDAKKVEETKKRKAEEKKDDGPKKEAKTVEAPKKDAKAVEAPKKDAKAVEAPKKDAKTVEPPKKDAKKEEAPKKDAKKAEAKKDEAAELEKEKDAPKETRPQIKGAIEFHPSDSTLNVVPTVGGRVLMALSEGGMQYLIAGARGNVGVKAGRYMYEVKIVEALNPAESSASNRGKVPTPRQVVRLGFSTAGSPLILGDGPDGVGFDSEGCFIANKAKTSVSQRFSRDQTIAVVLNLDPKSPNANTISLFREGERVAEPQKLPEHLHGKTLYPHVAFRGVTVQMLFGPAPARALPFKCWTLQGAAQADVEVKPSPAPKDGKYEVVLPVAFPDEGTFDWLDSFLAKHPDYVELSDRKILEWAAASGLLKPKVPGSKASNDKPEFNFGLPGMDDMSVRRVVANAASVVPRNYVVMEVKSNLVEAERKEALKRFSAPFFKKVAQVVMGEPKEEYKKLQVERLLVEKQKKADAEWKQKKADEDRKKLLEAKKAETMKKAQEARKRAEEAKAKKAEEAKKKAEEAKKKAEEAKGGKKEEDAEMEGGEPKPEGGGEEKKPDAEEPPKEDEAAPMEVDESKETAKEDAGKEEAASQSTEAKAKEETGPPKVELTEEEKKTWFKPPSGTPDLTPAVLSQSFGSFTIPKKDEGFDQVRFEWQGEAASTDYLKKWVLGRKRTSRIEDLQPSQWFKDAFAAWQKKYQEWQQKQKAFKGTAGKGDDKKKEGGDEAKAPIVGADSQDIFAFEDICDIGDGEPLFLHFKFEDWAMLQLRYELYLLQLAFRKDVDDPERIGVHETHMAFYYNKYFKKQLNPKFFGLTTNTELAELVKDTVSISPDSQVLVSGLGDDLGTADMFVKLTEESRRERTRRIDAGDETARLKFSPLAMQQPSQARPVVAPTGSVASVPAPGTPTGTPTTRPAPGTPTTRSAPGTPTMRPAPGTPTTRPAWQQQQQVRPSAAWGKGGGKGGAGGAYPQAGFQRPMMGSWQGQQQMFGGQQQGYSQQGWR